MRVRVGYGGSETVMRITAGIIEEQERTITSYNGVSKYADRGHMCTKGYRPTCEYLYIFCG